MNCNANTLPDECDIDLYQSLDCNENRVPDECDIALGTSADEDENGVPDECEGEQLSGGGESMSGASGEEASSQDGESYEDRLAAFEAWIIEQDFAGLSVPEQMRRIKRKMLELDLWP